MKKNNFISFTRNIFIITFIDEDMQGTKQSRWNILCVTIGLSHAQIFTSLFPLFCCLCLEIHLRKTVC